MVFQIFYFFVVFCYVLLCFAMILLSFAILCYVLLIFCYACAMCCYVLLYVPTFAMFLGGFPPPFSGLTSKALVGLAPGSL